MSIFILAFTGNGYQDNDYIFKHIDGSYYYPDYPSKEFRKLIKNNPELPRRITFHGLRSSCVSILIHQGLDVKSIQKWVGHADIDTTLRIYAKGSMGKAKEACRILKRLIFHSFQKRMDGEIHLMEESYH